MLDCEAIVQLMNNGFTFIDSCNLIKNKQNNKVFNFIKTRLNKGEDITDLFIEYCPNEIRTYFTSFIKFLPFKNSLMLSISIYEESKNQRNVYLKKLLYPILTLITTIIGIYIFILVCFPVLISLMKEFDNNLDFMLKLQNISYLFINVLFITILVLLLIVLYFIKKDNQIKGFKLISNLKLSRFIKVMISNDFARFYQQCILIGCSTKESINILKSINEKPIIVFLSNEIDKSLSNGETMEKAFKNKYFEKGLFRFLNIAMHASNMNEMLKGYIKLNELKVNKFFNVFSYSIQLFTYSSIALVLIFVYQILMMPLTIISNL